MTAASPTQHASIKNQSRGMSLIKWLAKLPHGHPTFLGAGNHRWQKLQ